MRAVFALLLVLPIAAASGQTTERTFYLAQARTAQNVQEIAVVIRMVAGIRDVSAGIEQNSVTVRGTAEDVRLAEWLVPGLDQPPDAPVPPEYRVPGRPDDALRMFRLAHARTPRDLQELATLIRSLADAQYLAVCTAPKTLVLRGTAWRISLAEWLIGELDRPPDERPSPGPHEYRLEGTNDEEDVVRIFYTGARTPEELAEILTRVRATVKMLPRAFLNSARGAIIVRATAAKTQSAAQVLKQP